MNIQKIISECNNQSFFIKDNVFAVKSKDGIAIAFNENDFFNIINNKDYQFDNIIDIDKNIKTAKKNIRKNSPVFVKVSQYGGMGGMLPGAGGSMGVGPFQSGSFNFENPSAREQFDLSLDMARSNGRDDGWNRTLETRMEENPLYGHQRNDKDGNLKNYRLTSAERSKDKKASYIKKMLENRKKFDEAVENNRVENIKNAPKNPKHYLSLEDKLAKKRQGEDNTEKRKYHGPESEFVHFPKKVQAAKVRRNGLSSIFDNDPEMMENEEPYPEGSTGRQRIIEFPWGMGGYRREKDSFNQGYFAEENNNLWGGNLINRGPTANDGGGKFNIDLRMNADGRDPGDPHPRVDPDKGAFEQVMKEMRKSIIQEEQRKNKEALNSNTEARLNQEHYDTPLSGVTPTSSQLSTKYPYADRNFFTPWGRINRSSF